MAKCKACGRDIIWIMSPSGKAIPCDPEPSRDPKWVKRCRYAYCPNCGAKMEVQE